MKGNAMRFTKMHGIGNDYVYINGFEQSVAEPAKLAQAVSDRHFGIGSDGLILILPSTVADVRMRMFNADGSEGRMCGNGIRCVAKYAYDHDLSRANPMRVETLAGVKTIELRVSGGKVASATVDMGEPILRPADIPMNLAGDRAVNAKIEAGGRAYSVTCVSMGNPHAVIYVDDVAAVDLERIGPTIERHEWFPQRVNVHFVQVKGPGEVTMRTWERGSGITWACGTGASAVCVAGVLTGKSGRKVLAHLPGGDLELEWRESNNRVYMTGPATEVFTGDWPE
jgi:diaminopimelate epimerase